MRVMIMGAPAAGKGTQCEKIVQKVLISAAACCHVAASMGAGPHRPAVEANSTVNGLSCLFRAAQLGAHLGRRPAASRGGRWYASRQAGAGVHGIRTAGAQ